MLKICRKLGFFVIKKQWKISQRWRLQNAKLCCGQMLLQFPPAACNFWNNWKAAIRSLIWHPPNPFSTKLNIKFKWYFYFLIPTLLSSGKWLVLAKRSQRPACRLSPSTCLRHGVFGPIIVANHLLKFSSHKLLTNLKVLLTHLCTKVTQVRDKAFSCPSDEDNQNFNDFIDFKLYDICWQFFESNCALYSPFKIISRNLLACLLRAFFLLSFFRVLLSDSASWVAWRLSERVWAGQIWWGLDHC